jgi:hypothetical protein
MKINPKMIRRPTVRKRGWRIENSKRRLKKREPEKGLKSCRRGQEVEMKEIKTSIQNLKA